VGAAERLDVGELEDDGVVDQAVDGSGCGHGVAEDSIPLAEDKVAGEREASALVALGNQREEDFGFLRALLDVAEVVEDNEVEAVELSQGTRQSQVALGGEQLLYDLVGRSEVDGATAS
jgi:hypothetical protein